MKRASWGAGWRGGPAAAATYDWSVQEVPTTFPGHELVSEGLSEADQGAHSRYNALIARVVSFARAAERASSG